MSIVDGTKIVAPVSVEDVRRVLGERWLDIGRLCTSDKIKRWPRHKPLPIDKLTGITDADRKNCSYGLCEIPQYTNLYQMAVDAFVSYDCRVGPDEYYMYYPHVGYPSILYKRLSDFDGYDHEAPPPVTLDWIGDDSIDADGFSDESEIEFMFYFHGDPSISVFDLHFGDGAVIIDDYYFGAVISDGSSSTYKMRPVPISKSGGLGWIVFKYGDIKGYANKDLAICPFLSPVADPGAEKIYASKPLVPLLFATKHFTIVRTPEPVPDFSGRMHWVRRDSVSRSKVHICYGLTNNTGEDKTVTRKIWFYYGLDGNRIVYGNEDSTIEGAKDKEILVPKGLTSDTEYFNEQIIFHNDSYLSGMTMITVDIYVGDTKVASVRESALPGKPLFE